MEINKHLRLPALVSYLYGKDAENASSAKYNIIIYKIIIMSKILKGMSQGMDVSNSALGLIDNIFGISARRQKDLASYQAELEQQLMERSNEMAIESEERAFDREKLMFDMENAYNDPSAQVDRLAAAGINPYKDGSIQSFGGDLSSVGASSAPEGSVSIPNVSRIGYQPLSQSYYQYEVQKEQNRLSSDKFDWQQVVDSQNLAISKSLADSSISLNDAYIGTEEQKQYLMQAQENESIARQELLSIESFEKRKTWDERYNAYKLANAKTVQDICESISRVDLNDANSAAVLDSLVTAAVSRMLQKAQIDYYNSLSANQRAQLGTYIAQSANAADLYSANASRAITQASRESIALIMDEFRQSKQNSDRNWEKVFGCIDRAVAVAGAVSDFVVPLKIDTSNNSSYQSGYNAASYFENPYIGY